MGSPLGPVLADFFMSMIEESMIHDIEQLHLYKRYVDDMLVVCESKPALDNFVTRLNICRANHKVTHETEVENSLSFLDIVFTRKENGTLSRVIYSKPTWTGQYLHIFPALHL